MSDSPRSHFDLSRLATVRGAEPVERAPTARRRRIDWRTWTPVSLLVLGLATLTGMYVAPLLEPVHDVTLTPIVVRQDVEARRSSVALQASGWAEPDPYPVRINAQVMGVIADLPVVEGTPLVAGETVVAQLDTTLIDRELAQTHAQYDYDTAQRDRLRTAIDQTERIVARNLTARLRVAELERSRADLLRQRREAQAKLDSATATLEQNAAARATLATRQRELATLEASLVEFEQQIRMQRARLPWLRLYAEALRDNVGGNAATELEAAQAESIYEEARERLAGFEGRRDAMERTVSAARDAVAVAADVVERPTELQAAVANARASVEGVMGQLDAVDELLCVARAEADDALTLQAQLETQRAELSAAEAKVIESRARLALLEARRELHTVVSPVDGEVLAVYTTPGGMLGTLSETMAIATAYDPSSVQVRVDLPLADVPAVAVGQRVEVSTEAVPGHVYAGEVTRLVRQANLARNSLQVKVRVLDADGRLKPDMLTRCRFLPLPRERSDVEAAERMTLRLFVPRAAVAGAGEAAAVYVYDPRGRLDGEGRARRLAVRVYEETDASAGHVEIEGDLREGYRVLLNPPGGLADGARVRPSRPAAEQP